MKNIIKEFKQDSAPGLIGINNLPVKEISKYTKAGNDIPFDDIPIPNKWFMHRKVVLIKNANRYPINPSSYRGISLLKKTYKLYSTAIALPNTMKKATKHI